MSDLVLPCPAPAAETDGADLLGLRDLPHEVVGGYDGRESRIIGMRDGAGGPTFVSVEQVVQELVRVGESARHGYSAARRPANSSSDIRSGSIAMSSRLAFSFSETTVALDCSPMRSTSTIVSMCSSTATRFSNGAAITNCRPRFL